MKERCGKSVSQHVPETLLHVAMLHKHKQIRMLWPKDQRIFVLSDLIFLLSVSLHLIVILWGES